MAIKISSNTVIDNNRRGIFQKSNPGTYTNSNRPSASTGDIIYNTSESSLQVWNGSAWTNACDHELPPSSQIDTSQDWASYFGSWSSTTFQNALGAWHPQHNMNHVFNGYTDLPSTTNWASNPGSGGTHWVQAHIEWKLPTALSVSTFEISFTNVGGTVAADRYINNGTINLNFITTADGVAGTSQGHLRYTHNEVSISSLSDIKIFANNSYATPYVINGTVPTWNYIKVNGKILAQSTNYKP